MNLEKVKEIMNRIPATLILGAFLAFQAFDYYDFMNNDTSPLLIKKSAFTVAKEARKQLEIKLKEANAFVKSLEKKKAELRALALELQGMKESLSDRLDIPNFMKMTVTESKKIGITVLSLKPTGTVNKEYYTEQNFKFTFRGIYAQLVTFMERLTNVTEIVRIENFSMKPVGSGRTKYVLLDVALEMKTYKYLGSSADKLGGSETVAGSGNSGSGNSISSTVPAHSAGSVSGSSL